MRRAWHNNSLSIVLLLLTLAFLTGEALAGWRLDSHARDARGDARQSLGDYVRKPDFLEAAAENWEGDFLNLAVLVWLTSFLHQKGSALSKDPDANDEVDREPDPARAGAPAVIRRGGWRLGVYQHSLMLGLVALFLCAFAVHAAASYRLYLHRALAEGRPSSVSFVRYLGNSQLWFESFQNWQSEFLGALAAVVLTIFLRQRGSPESKPVDAAHDETGHGVAGGGERATAAR